MKKAFRTISLCAVMAAAFVFNSCLALEDKNDHTYNYSQVKFEITANPVLLELADTKIQITKFDGTKDEITLENSQTYTIGGASGGFPITFDLRIVSVPKEDCTEGIYNPSLDINVNVVAIDNSGMIMDGINGQEKLECSGASLEEAKAYISNNINGYAAGFRILVENEGKTAKVEYLEK